MPRMTKMNGQLESFCFAVAECQHPETFVWLLSYGFSLSLSRVNHHFVVWTWALRFTGT